MADYRVNLEMFAGPLDLLLYLVRKEEVDIYDIPIAKITDQYIRYIELLKSLDIDLAGDFLVMAATLMQIKSAMLLPRAEPDQLADEDLSDPRTELVRQLLEYKRFKDAANLLNAAADEQQERYPRPGTLIERLKPDTEPELDIEQVSIWDLLEAFESVCKAIGTVGDIRHIQDDTPIDLYQIEILHRLQTEGPLTFERIFESRAKRLVMVGLFLALLELVRSKLVWAEQPAQSTIYLRSLADEPAEEAVRNAILATEASRAEQAQEQRTEEPPIPITQVPSRPKAPVSSGAPSGEQLAIPISELPAKTGPAIPSGQQEELSALNDQEPQQASAAKPLE
jgi:segregation and condensation protein A